MLISILQSFIVLAHFSTALSPIPGQFRLTAMPSGSTNRYDVNANEGGFWIGKLPSLTPCPYSDGRQVLCTHDLAMGTRIVFPGWPTTSYAGINLHTQSHNQTVHIHGTGALTYLRPASPTIVYGQPDKFSTGAKGQNFTIAAVKNRGNATDQGQLIFNDVSTGVGQTRGFCLCGTSSGLFVQS